MRLTHFGGVALPQARAESSIPRQARSNVLEMMDGVYDQDGSAVVTSPVQLSHRAVLVEDVDSSLDGLYARMRRAVGIIRATMRDGSVRQSWARLLEITEDMSWQDRVVQPVAFRFLQTYPYWVDRDDEPLYLDDGWNLDDGEVLDEGTVESESITSLPHTFTITNGGSAEIPRGEIRIEPGSGASVPNLRITNRANGAALAYEGSLSEGDVLVIDLLTRTVVLNGADDYDNMRTNDINWLPLAIGDNPIVVTGDAVSGTVELKWRWANHYV